MRFDHTTRQWGVRCKDQKSPRLLYWNGLGWTDEEKVAALMTASDAQEAASAIRELPQLQLSFCDGPQVIRLID